jgi:hypothetical protein
MSDSACRSLIARSASLDCRARRFTLFSAVLASVALLGAGSAHAELIAADSFLSGDDPSAGEYRDTGSEQFVGAADGTQSPDVFGFTGAWSGSGSTVAQWTAEAGGIGSDLDYEAGGRARFDGVDNLQRRVQRSLDTYTPADTYYMSFISTAALGETDGDGFVGLGFTDNVTDSQMELGGPDGMRGLLYGYKANPDGTTDLVIRHRDRLSDGTSFGAADTVIATDVEPAGSENSVDYVIIKVEFDAALFNPDGNDVVTVYLNPTDISSEAAALASSSTTTFNTFSLAANDDLTQLTMTGIDYSRPASFDEPRLGTEFADVVPEPGSMALLGLGGLLLASRRRGA